MPVIINELVIKASVDIGGEKKKSGTAPREGGKPLDRKRLIEECVEAVLRVLEMKGER